MTALENYEASKRKKIIVLIGLTLGVFLLFFASLFVGTSRISIADTAKAIFGQGEKVNVRIVQVIRIPRVLAALIAGAGLAVSGLVMQTTLRNPLASPSTLGVSNAAVFGANLAIIIFAYSGNRSLSRNPYLVTSFAFLFAIGAVFLILFMARFRGFSPETVILAGLGFGTLFTALTTIVQYFAQDTDLSSAIYWTFGDLGRASYQEDIIMAVVVILSTLVFFFLSYSYDSLLSGDDIARSLGVSLKTVRFLSLFLASLVTAVCIAFLGIIGFIGIIAPHIMKRVIGMNHRTLIPATALTGSIVLVFSDMIARIILRDASLPVGAITSLLGVPVFLYIIFRRKEGKSVC